MSHPEPTPSTITAINLSRLLSRLDQKLGFTPPPDPATPIPTPSSLERTKIAANLEYARKLLLELERESENVRNTKEREKTLAKLGEQKAVVRKLNEKLHLSAQEVDIDEDETDEEMEVEVVDSDEEDSRPVAPASALEISSTTPTGEEEEGAGEQADYPPPIQSTLRNRFPTQREERAALFAREEDGLAADGEKQLDVQRREQEDLTEDMLSLARALKENSIRFGQELDKEKGLLDLAGEGLDKNARGIESALRKMDALRKNENVNFMWTIIYVAGITGLAFFTLFILFFAPKLRW